MKVYRLMLVILLAMLISGLSACTPPAAPATPAAEAPAAEAPAAPAPTQAPAAAAEPATLVIAMNMDDAVTFDPAIAGETTNLFVHNSTYDQLVEIKAENLGKIEPKVADSWEFNDELTEFTFKLHPGIKFASGNDLTAEDVRFTYMRVFNMKAAASTNIEMLESVEVIDPMTVKFKLTSPTPQWLAVAANPSLGIQDSKLVKEHGGTDALDADKTDTAKDWLDRNSAGSGPYVMTNWTPKAEIVFQTNENYWRGKPYFDRVIIKHVSDPTSALQMIQRGDADMVRALDYDLVEQAEADGNLKVVIGTSLDQNYLAMTSNPDISKPLSNPTVRKAIAYAIDYDGIITAILRGYGTRAPSIIPVGLPGVDPNAVIKRDVAKAKELLKEAGYENGFQEKLHYGSNPTRETIAAKLKSDLAEVGITLNLTPMEQSVYLSEMRAQKLPMAFGGWTPDYLDVTMWTHFFSFPDTSIAFRMWYNSPKTIEIATAIESEMDEAKRIELTKQWQAQVMDDMPFLMLYQGQTITVMNKDIQGYAFHPVYFFNIADLTK